MLTSEHTAREIEQKARKVMGMLKRGVKFTPMQPDVMTILEKQYMDTTKRKGTISPRMAALAENVCLPAEKSLQDIVRKL